MESQDNQLPIQFAETCAPEAPAWIAEVADRAIQRQEQETIAAGLPDWPMNSRGLPNGVLRSALFGIGAEKYHLKESHIASIDGVNIFIARGPRLNQHHLDVWEECLQLAKEQGTGKRIEFTAYSFLKAIQRTTGSSDIEWLKSALYDLAGCVVRISDNKRTYFGPLIHGGTREEASGRYVIEINPKIALLYIEGHWTRLDCQQRKALRRHPLAQWLHAFYSTHAKPYPYKVETIMKLCGSEVSKMYKFRQVLRRSLDQLEVSTGWTCGIDENDSVVVNKAIAMPEPYRDSG